MAFGMSRRGVAAARSWSAVRGIGSNRAAGSWPQIICGGWALRFVPTCRLGSGGGLEHGVTQVAQGVVAAPSQLAGDGEDGELPVEALLNRSEVSVVG